MIALVQKLVHPETPVVLDHEDFPEVTPKQFWNSALQVKYSKDISSVKVLTHPRFPGYIIKSSLIHVTVFWHHHYIIGR